jgi:uncharacterized membrane protein YccC|tara:strand:+ start:130 stop:327 length:198 start_codon:yes stop_codon:yes gene_type:complete
MKNYQSILTAAVGLGVALLTINGTIQQYITFSGVLNEIAFTIMGLMLCICGLISLDYKKLVKGLL